MLAPDKGRAAPAARWNAGAGDLRFKIQYSRFDVRLRQTGARNLKLEI